MLIHWMLSISGAVDPARLQSALAAVLSRRPGLASTIRAARSGPVREPCDASGDDILTVWDVAEARGPGDAPVARTGRSAGAR